MEEKLKNQEKLSFIFEGGYEVDALTVSKTIDNLVNLMSITANSECPNAELRLSVSAVKPGSLEFYFKLVAECAKTLLIPENIKYASGVATIIVSYFEIKKHLKNKKQKSIKTEGDKLIIENFQGQIIKVDKGSSIYFDNLNLDMSVTNIINAASNSDQVTGIAVQSNENKPINITQSDFSDLSTPIDQLIETTKQITYQRQDVLFIKKPDLLGDSMWVFQADKQITADIKDEDFMKKIHSGDIKVCAGMSVDVDLMVQIDLGANGLPVEKTSKYTVLKVRSVNMPGENQTTIY